MSTENARINYANLTPALNDALTKPQPIAEGSETVAAKILTGQAPIFEKSKIDPTVASPTTRWRMRLIGVANNASLNKVLEAANRVLAKAELNDTHTLNVTGETTQAVYKGTPMRTFILSIVWTPIADIAAAAAATTEASAETAASPGVSVTETSTSEGTATPPAKAIKVTVSGKFTATASGVEGQTLREVLTAAKVADPNSFSYRSGNTAVSLDRKLTASMTLTAAGRSSGG